MKISFILPLPDNKVLNQVFVFLMLCLLGIACRKAENQDPVIEFIQPSSLITLNAGDSLDIEANVRDDHSLSLVTVQLLNQNEQPVSTALVYHPSNNSFHFKALYVINNTSLESGTYLLTIYASDGTNEVRRAREIEIMALPLKREKVFAITSNNTSVRIFDLDSSGIFQSFKMLPGDFLGSSVSSRYQRLHILGHITGSYTILDAHNADLIREIPTASPLSTPYFENLNFQNEWDYISFYDGNIKAYDESGLLKFSVQQQSYFRPGACFQAGDYFFAELYYTASGLNKLGTFFFPGGAARQEVAIDLDIHSMHEKSADELYLFGTSNGNMMAEVFNRQQNRTSLLRNFGTMQLFSVLQSGPDEFLFATDQGIHKYKALTNSWTSVIPGMYQRVRVDSLNSELWLASSNQINVLDMNSLNLKYTYSLPDSILDIQILYNK